jgi:L-aspartate oxidase
MASKVSNLGPARSPRFAAASSERLGAHGDVVIVGAGLAGLFTALKLAPMHVTVLAAAPLGASRHCRRGRPR